MDTLNICIFINLRANMYTHRTLKRHRRTLRPQIKYPPNHKQGFVRTIIQNPPPETQNHFMWEEEKDEDGEKGKSRIRQRAQCHPAGSPSLMLRAGRRRGAGAGGAVSSGQSTR